MEASIDRLPKRSEARIECARDGLGALSSRIERFLRCDTGLATWFARDIIDLRDRFSATVDGRTLHAGLECARSQTCTLLHVDNLPLRLLTTYRGSGTTWIRDIGVRRQHLGTQNDTAVCPDITSVRQAKRFAVLVMKGARYPEHDVQGLVHRSPHMVKGDMRLVLRIDAHGS